MASTGAEFNGVRFDPAATRDAAMRLDGLAERLENELRAGEVSLKIAPAGADEVSQRAAQTMNEVAASYAESAAAGALELRKLAATFRSQARQFDRAEGDNADSFGGGAGVA
ncbi:PE family protein [Nocardia iowensis]|uniref:PE family protein n=1 Tax=Nocardia iowensis TaxID=204891 RepID=A0ABX8RU31_NOCIO|nr:PE family protein [Nocardia iowensis]QXN92502.1 PE family protein [Nocardia iowensis]